MLKKYLMPLIVAANLLTNQEDLLANAPLPDRTREERDESTPLNRPIPKRGFSFNLGTIYTFENNDKVWSSLHQLAGKGNDYLGLDLEGDKSILGRVGLGMVSLYFSGGFQYYKHELSHEFDENNKDFEINFTNWIIPYNIGVYPQYLSDKGTSLPHIEDYLRSSITGLNQDEYTGYTSWKRSVFNDSISFDEGIFFLVHKLFDLQYILATETVLERENFESQEKGFTSWWYEDIDGYIRLMEMEDNGLTKKEYTAQILVADLLSWHTSESIYSVFEYLTNGKRTSKTTTFEINDTIRITPPLISLYLTSQGSFYDLTSFIHYKSKDIGVSIGTDLDFAGGGNLDTVRIGGEFHSVNFNPLAINPFCYLDFERTSFHYTGLSSGLELLLEVTSSTSLQGKFEYNTEDIIENTVKREGEGLNFVLGINLEI